EVVALLHSSFDSDFRAEARLFGSEGSLHLPDIFRADVRDGSARIRLERGGEVTEMTVEGDQYGAQVASMAHRVRTGTPDAANAALTRRTAATLARIHAQVSAG